MYKPGLNQLTVSRETVRKLSMLLLEGEGWTGRTLARELDVSVVTVGKVVEEWKRVGLLEESLLPTERGRSPRRIQLAPRSVAWGILRMEERGCSLILADTEGNLIEKQGLPYDAAMSPEGNAALLRGAWHAWRNRLKQTYLAVGLGVILRESRLPYWETSVLEAMDGEADCIEREERLTAEALSDEAKECAVHYFQLDREIRTMLVMGEEWQGSKDAAAGADRYEALVEDLIGMARIITPARIVAESVGKYESDAGRLLRRLRKRWQETGLPFCPEMILSEELTFAERSMVGRLNRAFAREIAREVGR